LGEYPLVTLAEAREGRLAARKLCSTGADPMAERKAKGEAKQQAAEAQQRQVENSFENVARKWWAYWSEGKDPGHARAVLSRLENDVFAAFGSKFIDDVTTADVRGLMLAIEGREAREAARREGRIFEGREARETAKRAHGTISQIFRWAILNEHATRYPAAFKPGDVLAQATPENHARVDEKEMPELLVKIDDYDRAPTGRVGAKRQAQLRSFRTIARWATKLLAYTFVRTNEALEAPWAEFDLDGARWTIPPERMKMKRTHIVPLSRQAVEVLRALHALTGKHKFVFPGAFDKSKPIGRATVLRALYAMGFKGSMTGHGFRGVASTILNESGKYEEAHINMQLAHVKRDKTAAAYNHAKYLTQRTQIMQDWADHLDEQLARGRAALAA